MGLYAEKCGFTGKRKRGGTVNERKAKRRLMARAVVKKLKAEGKPVDLQAINQEVLEKTKRQR